MDKSPETTRILIVDDDPRARHLLADILAIPGYRTEEAASGSEALASARQDPPDLVLLDLTMAQMDGMEVCRHLKADARCAHVPVLIVTGMDDMRHKEEGLAAGADDYITKPVIAKDFLARVRALLRVSHLSQQLDRTLAYVQELDVTRSERTDGGPLAGGTTSPPPVPTTKGLAPRVLVVDDDRFIRRMFGRLLEEAGYRVTLAGDAIQAFEAVCPEIDAILLDIMMPEISGLEALSSLRLLAPDVPIIIVTAFQTSQNAIAALRGGAFDFIVKGMKSELLLNSVARAVERRRLTLENHRLMEELRARLTDALAPRVTHPG
jgi:two-component system cell cycle response regulator